MSCLVFTYAASLPPPNSSSAPRPAAARGTSACCHVARSPILPPPVCVCEESPHTHSPPHTQTLPRRSRPCGPGGCGCRQRLPGPPVRPLSPSAGSIERGAVGFVHAAARSCWLARHHQHGPLRFVLAGGGRLPPAPPRSRPCGPGGCGCRQRLPGPPVRPLPQVQAASSVAPSASSTRRAGHAPWLCPWPWVHVQVHGTPPHPTQGGRGLALNQASPRGDNYRQTEFCAKGAS
jgi:hypothetical protein